MKKKIQLIIDISMTLLLPLLMAYSLIGEAFHEVVGIAMFVLFIVHHILNRKWYGALFKGKYNARRIFHRKPFRPGLRYWKGQCASPRS